MDFKIIATVVGLSIVIITIGILLPGGGGVQPQTLPWQIDVDADGSSRVFGLALGRSTLRDAERQLEHAPDITLFEDANRSRTLEAYFEPVTLGGLSARVVLTLALPGEQLDAMFERGARIGALSGDRRKVSLNARDIPTAYNATISSIAYLPRAQLDAASITKRFGAPVQRLTETDGSTTHWLYPAVGLDIALDARGHAVLQYVAPARFEVLTKPLQEPAAP